MTQLIKFKCNCGKLYYKIFDGFLPNNEDLDKNGFTPNNIYDEDPDKDEGRFTGCYECSDHKSDALKHYKFSKTEIDILTMVSWNIFYIGCLREENEELKNSVKSLKEEREEDNIIIEQLQRQIEALRVAHESLLDTFRGYNK